MVIMNQCSFPNFNDYIMGIKENCQSYILKFSGVMRPHVSNLTSSDSGEKPCTILANFFKFEIIF